MYMLCSPGMSYMHTAHTTVYCCSLYNKHTLCTLCTNKQAGVDEGEDSGSSQRASQAIEAALGTDKRNGVLAALYLARSDTSSVVRQGALQVTDMFN
jgi:hypothetical protein